MKNFGKISIKEMPGTLLSRHWCSLEKFFRFIEHLFCRMSASAYIGSSFELRSYNRIFQNEDNVCYKSLCLQKSDKSVDQSKQFVLGSN